MKIDIQKTEFCASQIIPLTKDFKYFSVIRAFALQLEDFQAILYTLDDQTWYFKLGEITFVFPRRDIHIH